MKIIHVLAGKADPNTLNGVNKVIHSLAQEQINAGYEVSVYGVANNGIRRHKHLYKLKLFRKNFINLLPPSKLLKQLKLEKKDSIIHLHSAFVPWFPLFAVYLKCTGFNYIVTPHGAYDKSKLKKDLIKAVYFFLVESLILLFAQKIHFIGKSELNIFTSIFAKNKSHIIPNGCFPTGKSVLPIVENLLFGYMGRLTIDHKGLDLLINGFNLYKGEKGKGVLLLAGNGPHKAQLVSLVKKLNMEKYVFFIGEVFDKEKEEFLQNISFFVHTSRWDVIPTGCLEAASFCTPLMVSKETNLGEYIEHYGAGYVLPDKSPAAIKDAFLKLERTFYNSRHYQIMRENVKNMVEETFVWQKINSQIVKKLYGI